MISNLPNTPVELLAVISHFTYESDGDNYEVSYGDQFARLFPSHEKFWKRFITIMTNRVDSVESVGNNRIRARADVDKIVVLISQVHYSIFMKYRFAMEAISSQDQYLNFFDNYTTYLSNICDLTEEMVIKVSKLISKLNESFIGKNLLLTYTKEEILLEFSRTLEKDFQKAHDKFFKADRNFPIWLFSGEDIFRHLSKVRKDVFEPFVAISREIRAYRNIAVHGSLMGSGVRRDRRTGEQRRTVPSPDFLRDFPEWNNFFMLDPQSENMKDLNELIVHFNDELLRSLEVIWDKFLIPNLSQYLYDEPTELFWGLFGLAYKVPPDI